MESWFFECVCLRRPESEEDEDERMLQGSSDGGRQRHESDGLKKNVIRKAVSFNAQPQAPATFDESTGLVAGACGWALNNRRRATGCLIGAELSRTTTDPATRRSLHSEFRVPGATIRGKATANHLPRSRRCRPTISPSI